VYVGFRCTPPPVLYDSAEVLTVRQPRRVHPPSLHHGGAGARSFPEVSGWTAANLNRLYPSWCGPTHPCVTPAARRSSAAVLLSEPVAGERVGHPLARRLFNRRKARGSAPRALTRW